MVTGCLRCTYCQSELIEELSDHAAGQNDTRSLMAKFNDQIEPIYALLRKLEDIRLSADILEPEPTDLKPSRLDSLFLVFALPLPSVVLVLQLLQSGNHSHLAFVMCPLPILSVAFLKLSASSRPLAPPSGSAKCLRFGLLLTCTPG